MELSWIDHNALQFKILPLLRRLIELKSKPSLLCSDYHQGGYQQNQQQNQQQGWQGYPYQQQYGQQHQNPYGQPQNNYGQQQQGVSYEYLSYSVS